MEYVGISMDYVGILMDIALKHTSNLITLPTDGDLHKKYNKCKSNEGLFKVASARPSSEIADFRKRPFFDRPTRFPASATQEIYDNLSYLSSNPRLHLYVQYLIGPLISHTPRIRKLQNASRQYVFFPMFLIYPEMHEGSSRVTPKQSKAHPTSITMASRMRQGASPTIIICFIVFCLTFFVSGHSAADFHQII